MNIDRALGDGGHASTVGATGSPTSRQPGSTSPSAKPVFGQTPPEHRRFVPFKGATFEPERDANRLALQLGDVRRFMGDAEWHTLRAISEGTGHPEASVSARLRDLRKRGHVIEREYLERGLHQYRMTS